MSKAATGRREITLWVDGTLPVKCSMDEPGYYLGSVSVGGVNHHFEAVEVGRDGDAKSQTFQNRIDAFRDANDDEEPQLAVFNRRRFFVHMEPFAK